ADRLGRRRIFLVAMIGMGLGELLTSLSPTPAVFAALQLVTRAFLLASYALGIVIMLEELPPGQRGAGLAFLFALSGFGYGLAAALYAAIEVIPGGWRTLYVFGGAPLLLLPLFRRELPETRRFTAAGNAASRRGLSALWLEPVRELVTHSPQRAVLVGLAAALAAFGGIGFFQYASFHLENIHGWSPAGYALLVGAGGAIGLPGEILGGRLSDRWGRRRVALVAYLVAPAGIALFYLGPAWLLVFAWGGALFFMMAADVVVRAFFGELFPTSHRSTSLAWMLIVQTVGWTGGLFAVDALSRTADDLPIAVVMVGGACALAGLCLMALPETTGSELDAGAGERA
ncbi:MAG: MFS transporter, partial [Planctomycetes bacterium]|nr:MFS transporter [Planctomycetota bacterium]